MSKVLQLRGGSSGTHDNFIGANRELTVDTDKKTAVIHDGVTPGGYPLAKESQIVAIESALNGKLDTESITTLVLQDNKLKFTDENSVTHEIPLTPYIDDTNLARITSGSVDIAGVATFTRDDGSSFTINMSSFLDDTKLSAGEIDALGFAKKDLTNVSSLPGSVITQLRGYTGSKGANGTNGATGAKGSTGYTGSRGSNGTNGATGTRGYTGSRGATGATGASGASLSSSNWSFIKSGLSIELTINGVKRSVTDAYSSPNCNCDCACETSCFAPGQKVLMADGSYKNIEDVKIGEQVQGAYGSDDIATVKFYDRPLRGSRSLYNVNGVHTTKEHGIVNGDLTGFVYVDIKQHEKELGQEHICNDGEKDLPILFKSITNNTTTKKQLVVGDTIRTRRGSEEVNEIKLSEEKPERLYNLVLEGGSMTYCVSDVYVSGFADDDKFDYEKGRIR